jgi:peptidoglycan hydrolase-like protein with peptidoglycan-binding domain
VVGDKDGWLGELTMMSVEKFQKDKGLAATGKVDADTFSKIFEGDTNVNVVL